MDFAPDLDYMAPVTEADNSKNETVRLMQYACSRILREGSPIQNVVMDLSCNGGGNTGAAEYVMATFLGEADFSIKNTMTGALTDSVYTIDTNLDGVFDEKDTLAGKGLNLFCITSPLSFSCGNLVPCVFKSSQKVTLLGQTSGGGSCSVHCFTTVYGSSFQVSGFRRFSVMKNGSFYDIDLGADPDYYIARPEKFYTREALTEFINGLY
jgi:C-terminal processing protease CtpA/Prc